MTQALFPALDDHDDPALPDEEAPGENEILLSIPIRLIDIPDGWREIEQTALDEMIESIRELKLLHPIGVVQGPGPRFTLLFGRTRLLATQTLGFRTIKARVFQVEDDEHRQVITDVENLRRSRLEPAEEARAMRRWREWNDQRHPESRQAGNPQLQRPPDAPAADGTPAPPPRKKEPSFVRKAARQRGQTTRQVKNVLKIARQIPDDYLKDFGRLKVSQADLLRIARIEPEDDRLAVCNLIATVGIPIDEAINDITAPKGQVVDHPQSRAIPADVPPYQQTPEEDLSDDDWFDRQCKDVAKRLGDQARAKYKVDALLYRKIRPAREEFKGKTKAALAQSKKINGGPFRYLMRRAVNVDHPKTWLACPNCQGTGVSPHRNDCPKCLGNGYTLTTVAVKVEKHS